MTPITSVRFAKLIDASSQVCQRRRHALPSRTTSREGTVQRIGIDVEAVFDLTERVLHVSHHPIVVAINGATAVAVVTVDKTSRRCVVVGIAGGMITTFAS